MPTTLSQLTKACFPPADASPRHFRISGTIFVIVALVLGAAGFTLFMSLDQMQLLMPLLLLPIIVWLIGAHRILWGGTAPANRWMSMGRVVVSAVVGYLSLMAISGLLGAIIGLLNKSA